MAVASAVMVGAAHDGRYLFDDGSSRLLGRLLWYCLQDQTVVSKKCDAVVILDNLAINGQASCRKVFYISLKYLYIAADEAANGSERRWNTAQLCVDLVV